MVFNEPVQVDVTLDEAEQYEVTLDGAGQEDMAFDVAGQKDVEFDLERKEDMALDGAGQEDRIEDEEDLTAFDDLDVFVLSLPKSVIKEKINFRRIIPFLHLLTQKTC